MNNRDISIICIILIFCMLFSVIGMKQIPYSVNECKSVTSNVQQIKRLDVISVDSEICTTEMLGVRTVVHFTNEFKTSYGQTFIKMSVILLYVNSYIQCISELYHRIQWDMIPKLYIDVIILDFIHNKDGEK